MEGQERYASYLCDLNAWVVFHDWQETVICSLQPDGLLHRVTIAVETSLRSYAGHIDCLRGFLAEQSQEI